MDGRSYGSIYMTAYTQNNSAAQSARTTLSLITLLRAFFFTLFIIIADRFMQFGTALSMLSLGASLGIVLGTLLAFSKLKDLALIALAIGLFLILKLLFIPLALAPTSEARGILFFYALEQHLNTILIFFYLGLFSSWAFWRKIWFLTFELILITFSVVLLLSPHRAFQLNRPSIIDDLSWAVGISQIGAFVMIGVTLVLALASYTVLATLPTRPWPFPERSVSAVGRGKLDTVRALILGLAVGITIYLIALQIFDHYQTLSVTRVANGVGQAREEGISPLGFHSALGSNDQPSALVRFEGDYPDNPFSPMLYIRETALSEFNGRELAIASRIYDQDVTFTDPNEPYTAAEDVELTERTPLVQSIYLLAEHKNVFAVDYPINIRQLKNPNPSRFKATYRAYSMAPAFSVDPEKIKDTAVGDKRWSEDINKHYLIEHPDPRYRELAKRITDDLNTPVEKIHGLIEYLNKTSIYTLSPGHEVKENEDPVAPFLFGDKRGYCVHFSHATVYMLRALGIPARIGTGYLTDLSQAKDGHILLRMSDRHAWAEAYLNGYGWVPFDTKPEQVESHAVTPVDMKVLEELMGMLDPGEEILPKDITKNEKSFDDTSHLYIPSTKELLLCVTIGFLFLLFIKIFLRFGWLLPSSPETKLTRSYRALLSWLYDSGFRRKFGETRAEFKNRLYQELGIESLLITELILRSNYSRASMDTLKSDEVSGIRRRDFEALGRLKFARKLLARLNPASAFFVLSGARW